MVYCTQNMNTQTSRQKVEISAPLFGPTAYCISPGVRHVLVRWDEEGTTKRHFARFLSMVSSSVNFGIMLRGRHVLMVNALISARATSAMEFGAWRTLVVLQVDDLPGFRNRSEDHPHTLRKSYACSGRDAPPLARQFRCAVIHFLVVRI